MKKILYLIATGLLTCAVAACDDEPKNPGDYSINADLNVGNIVSKVNGEVFDLNINRTFDTIFMTNYVVRDTIQNPDGTQTINTDTIWQKRPFTTKYIEAGPVLLPSTVDTFAISITSNAKWYAPVPTRPAGANWYTNLGVTSGGGDGKIEFSTLVNNTTLRPYARDLYVYTSDSTVMWKININQRGARD